ncbi:MAG: ABC transporter ATP-binding protein [Candidatus Sulfobium sp.]
MTKLEKAKVCLRDILKKPEPRSGEFGYREILFFGRFVRPLWKTGLAALILSLVATALSSLLPLSGKVLIDFVVLKKNLHGVGHFLRIFGLSHLFDPVGHAPEALTLVVLAVLAVGAAAGITGIIQKYLALRFQQELTFNVQTTLFDHLLRFPLPFFKRQRTGYLMSRVSDDIYVLQMLFSESIGQVFAKAFYFLFGMMIVFALSVKLSLILAAALPVYLLINYFFGARIRDASLQERESSARVSSDIQEVLSGVETIKAYTAEERESQKVSRGMRAVIHKRIRGMFLSLFSNYAAAGSLFAANLVIMWFGIHEVLQSRLTIGDYVAFTSYAVLLSGALNSILTFHIMVQPVFASLERLKEIFSLIPEYGGKKGTPASCTPRTIRGNVTFDDVSFGYEEGRPVLRNISFTAKPGEIIALAGPTGAGKTSLVNLLLRFETPQQGVISLDGGDIREIPPEWLRGQVGVVSQEVFLFDDTIENNIRYGRPVAGREDVVRAARLAHIHDDIEAFADGYETEVGERGVRLSAGQRQRISIARAFLRNPAILILDEPTSSLDPSTEALVKDSISRLAADRTTFIVAHRLSMVDMADAILVLNEGRIVERGRHAELLRKDGFYRKLYDGSSGVRNARSGKGV